MLTKQQKHAVWGSAWGALATVAVLGLSFLGLFHKFELTSFDFRMNLRNAWWPPQPAPEVVIVSIDPDSNNPAIAPSLGAFPWARSAYAVVIDRLQQAGASVIGLDIEFASPGRAGPEHDARLAEAARKAGNVVMVSTITSNETEYGESTVFKTPIDLLAESVAGYGVSRLFADSDNIYRQAQLLFEYPKESGTLHPAFAMEMLRHHFHWTGGREDLPRRLAELRVPAGRPLLINFASRRMSNAFPTYAFYQVHDGLLSNMEERFKGKLVLIGATDPILQDLFSTPLIPEMPGVEVHANILHTLLTKAHLHPTPLWVDLALIVLSGAATTWLVLYAGPLAAAAACLALLLALVGGGVALFVVARVWMPLVTPAITVLASLLTLFAYRYATEGKKARQIKAMFSRYVSQQVVEEILKDPDRVGLGGKKRQVTVLFSDIRNFTTISERLSPEALVSQLNEYLTEMVDIVIKYQGTVDKFVGDAVMAVWGAPVSYPDDTTNAVRAALEMQQRLEGLRQKWQQEGKEAFHIGVGVNMGEAISGNMGAPMKLEYTVIGDTVNVAARLESLTKEHHAKVLVSEDVAHVLGDQFEVRQIGEVAVKGKTKPVAIFEVLDYTFTRKDPAAAAPPSPT